MILFFILALQGGVMLVDEIKFHRRRGLPRWERIGHPLDTATVLACSLFTMLVRPDASHALGEYVLFAGVSCVFITKDEWVHQRLCSAEEQWLHSLLFVLHPLSLLALALLWRDGIRSALAIETLALAAFATYQVIYWRAWSARCPAPIE